MRSSLRCDGDMIATAMRWATGTSITRTVSTLLLGAALGGTLAHQVHRAINTRAALQHAEQAAQQQRQTLRAIEATHAETTRLQETADAATRRAAARTQADQRAHAGARNELDRLRQRLASTTAMPASSPPAGPPAADRADPAREILGACAADIVELGRAADAHAADAMMLHDAWPRPPD